ncbi:MAG TPA: SRPBCC family protein [Acidimicrobiia bacterium]|nr:SRPBCC family protein [Acidimicrobiia bacterium]
MRSVTVLAVLPTSPAQVWALIDDIEGYSRYMPHLEQVRVVSDGPGTGRIADWVLAVGGRRLGWTDRSDGIPDRFVREFDCLDGDLGFVAGRWELKAIDGGTNIRLGLEFDVEGEVAANDVRAAQDVFVEDFVTMLSKCAG